ncbi:MAG: hypothetical protein IJ507_05455 [Clostridia bacterium]|nr:hypothetical protein [Clostridia bacterium]
MAGGGASSRMKAEAGAVCCRARGRGGDWTTGWGRGAGAASCVRADRGVR